MKKLNVLVYAFLVVAFTMTLTDVNAQSAKNPKKAKQKNKTEKQASEDDFADDAVLVDEGTSMKMKPVKLKNKKQKKAKNKKQPKVRRKNKK